jgi:hypothetical protein
MGTSKIDELICLTAWSAAFLDGQKDGSKATEDEKNIVRAMRAFFKMDADRFNEAYARYKSYSDYLIELKDKDPITKIVARYSALKVAFKENEDGTDKSNLSDIEWEFIKKIDDSINIKIVYNDIKVDAYDLVDQIIDYKIEDWGEDETALIAVRIWSLLRSFFNSLENNNLFDLWEENYLSLLKYKLELRDVFGSGFISFLDEFANRYKELRPLISNFKKEKLAIEKQLAKEKAELEKNKTHEYSVSNGIHYCKYCGGDENWRSHECQRELGHKYTLRRVQNKVGFDYSFQPVCNNCGDIRHYCNMDWEYKFKCETK